MSKTETQSVALSLALLLRMQRDSASGVVTHNAASRAAAELEWLDAENKALRARLEIDPSHPIDGIAARDETIRQLEAQIKSLTSDADRLDHLQRTGSTIDLLPACGSVPVRFRVGGLAETVSMDIRSAIDAARAAKTGGAA